MRFLLIPLLAVSFTSAFPCVDDRRGEGPRAGDRHERHTPMPDPWYTGRPRSITLDDRREQMREERRCIPCLPRWMRDRDFYRNGPYVAPGVAPCVYEDAELPGKKKSRPSGRGIYPQTDAAY